MKKLFLTLCLLCIGRLAWGAACAESPTGQSNCEVVNARNQNSLATPGPNFLKVLGNNAAAIAVPTPAAGECILGDETATSATDGFTLRCNNGVTVFNTHLLPGTAVAGRAPLYFSSGPLLPTPEAGAMEYLNHTVYFTTFLVRRSFNLNQDIVTADTTVTNTAVETTIYTIEMAANYLTVGKIIRPKLRGIYSLKNGHSFTLRLKYAGNTVIAITSNTSAVTNAVWMADLMTTIRTIGAGGTAISFAKAAYNNVDVSAGVTLPTAINTTIDNTMTVTVQWSNADPVDSFTLQQGYTEAVQ